MSKAPHQLALEVLIDRSGEWSRVKLRSGKICMCYDVAWKFDPQDRVAHITTNISPGPDSAHQVDNFRADEIVRIEDPKSPGGQPLFEHE